MKELLRVSRRFVQVFSIGLAIMLSSGISKAQIQINFDNITFPSVGPPAISTPLGTGTTDEGAVVWYRGDNPLLLDAGTGTPNAGLNPGRGGSGHAAVFNSWDIALNGKADLIVEDVDLSSGYSPFAVMKFWIRNTSGTDVIRVFARNGADPYVQVGASSYGVFANFTEVTVNLASVSGPGKTTVDIRFEGTSDYGATNIGIDDILITVPDPMALGAVQNFQNNTVDYGRGLPNQHMMRVNIPVTGASSPFSPATFYFRNTGTTNANSVTNAKLWNIGAGSVFNPATATQIGNIVASPTGAFSIAVPTQILNDGPNNFVLSYDIPSTAALGDTIDVSLDSIRFSNNTTNIPANSASMAQRRVVRPAIVMNANPGLATSGNGRAPSTGALYTRSASIFPPSEYPGLKAGDSIRTVGFEMSALGAAQVPVSGNIKIYMQNTADAAFTKSTTWPTTVTGMQLVYDGPLNIYPEVGTFDIRLQSAFAYAATNFYIAFEYNITSPSTALPAGTAATFFCNNAAVGGGNGLRSVVGNTPGAPPTTLATSAFRPSIRLGVQAAANDVAVTNVYAHTQMPIAAGSPQRVSAVVRNQGFNAVSNYTVTMTVRGANTFTSSKTASLGFLQSGTVQFDGYTPSNLGNDTIRVSVASDDVNSNNFIDVASVVNNNTFFSYVDNSATAGALGFNTGAGMFLTRYTAKSGWSVDSVRAFIANNAATAGKRLVGVVLNSNGTIIARSDTATITVGELNNFKTFTMNGTTKVVADEVFYVGFAQIANAAGYFPLGTQVESPARAGAYFTASGSGASITETTTNGRFALSAYISAPSLPAPVVALGGDRTICAGDSTTIDAGNPGATYLWSTGATTQSIVAKTAGNYSVVVRNAQGYPVRDTLAVTVNQFVPVSVSIAQSPTGIVCAGANVTFTATPTNGGTSPTYAWWKNGSIVAGETNATYTTNTLVNGDQIAVILTSSEQCKTGSPDTSNIITMQVSAGASAVTVSTAATSTGPYCAGSPITIQATPSNGGSAPSYKWYRNNVLQALDTLSSYTSSSLANNDTIRVELTSNSLCILGNATVSNIYVANITSLLPVSVSIAAASDVICEGDVQTYTATAVNGGTNPKFKWFINNIEISGDSTATFSYSTYSNNDTVTCQVMSSEICKSGSPASSNARIVTVNPLPGSAFTNSAAGRAVTFTNTSTNANSSAWDFGDGNTSTANNPTHTYAADGQFTVRLITTNACGSDTLNKFVTVATLDVTVSAMVAPVSACELPNQIVRVRVRNQRAAVVNNVPISYTINGGAVQNDTVASINGNSQFVFTFKQNFNFSANGTYNIVVWTNLGDDFDRSNDSLVSVVQNQSAPAAAFTSAVTGADVTFSNTTVTDATTTYAWDFGDGASSTTESPSHTYATAGTYNVTMIASNPCGKDTIGGSVTITNVGIEQNANLRDIRVYPNPNNGLFSISSNLETEDNLRLVIIDLTGKVVFSKELGTTKQVQVSVDGTAFSAGIYQVQISGSKTQINSRINIIR